MWGYIQINTLYNSTLAAIIILTIIIIIVIMR